MSDDLNLPTDSYSRTLSRLLDHPDAVKKTSTINVVTLLGHTETWVVTTVRIDSRDTVFLQRIDAAGGMRLVVPSEVTTAMIRHRDGIENVNRRRGARKAAATREAKGIRPAFERKKDAV
jgi:hypothetical protein